MKLLLKYLEVIYFLWKNSKLTQEKSIARNKEPLEEKPARTQEVKKAKKERKVSVKGFQNKRGVKM